MSRTSAVPSVCGQLVWCPSDPSQGIGRVIETEHRRVKVWFAHADVERVYLATSRDGLNYDLRFVYAEQPLIGGGPRGSFDNGTLLPASEIVTYNDEHWVYYKAQLKRSMSLSHSVVAGMQRWSRVSPP